MALAVNSSSAAATSNNLFSRLGSSSETKVPQIGSIRILERPHVSSGFVNLPQRRTLVKPLNAEPQRNDSLVPLAATIVAPEVIEKEEEDFEQLARSLENASPLEIMDRPWRNLATTSLLPLVELKMLL